MSTLTHTAAHINSTIVRLSLATGFRMLSHLHPRAARSLGERLFTTPPRHKRAYAAPAAARRETVLSDAGHLAVWRSGPETAPAVLLVHGWGGVGAQLGRFVPDLLAQGFRVVWFDLPGHGSSDGRQTTLPDLVRAIHAVANTCGPFRAAIGHSLGAAAVALAMRRGLPLERAVLIAPPASMREHMRGFASRLGLTRAVRDAIRNSIEHRHQWSFDDIDRIEDLGRIATPTLLIHDEGDRHVAPQESQRIARCLPNAHLTRTFGLGHFRILRDPIVAGLAARFVAGETAPLPASLPALPFPAPIF